MVDHDVHVRKIGKEFSTIRKPHLEILQPLVEYAKEQSELPVVYDVTRLNPPYFHEYTFTEFLGCLYISPQSTEVAARLVDFASKTETEQSSFNIVTEIFKRNEFEPTLDKYRLNNEEIENYPKKVVFIPGDNIFKPMISREILTRIMIENDECKIKPHPMTSPDLIRVLGREFGYRRILDPMLSGWNCLKHAQEVYCSTSTEMGIYASILEKPIYNIGNFFNEAKGAYSPFYRLLWNKAPDECSDILYNVLNSPYSGVFHPKDPDVRNKIKTFFAKSLEIREDMKPLVYEIGPTEWADIQMSKITPQPQKDKNAVSSN